MFYRGKEPSCNGLGLVGKHKALLILFNKPLKHVSPEQLPQTFHNGTTVSAFKSVFNQAVLQWIEQKGMETTIVCCTRFLHNFIADSCNSDYSQKFECSLCIQ